ncbi:major facilitator superfamily domain-containing protein [Amylocarpus encephaloides]|uniref:Major facilitator superfamily domain-containing protein n=1 Tax=Amylocarpus encephaloides TaxID=45428 RepID=A0A9P7YIX2_9HELO|nr:major facilitator superfamily domain-containing protein [Amylocarpus encephaloides]
MSPTATITQTPVELQRRGSDRPSFDERTAEVDTASNDEIVFQQLGRVDGGLKAWTVLIAAFVFEALLWGFPISFGVFQDYYSTLPQFADNPNIALIGTVAQGFPYITAPLFATLTRRFPKYRRQMIWFGWPVCLGGLVAGSFADTLDTLIATQGIIYGFGFVTFTYPILSMVDEWWVARKGMAFGLITSAGGAAGVVMPFIVNTLLTRYGYKTTLRAIAVAMFILTAPLVPSLKGRLPISNHTTVAKTNWSFFRKPLFYFYGLSTLVQGFGLFFPSLFLPSYATGIGLTSTQGALVLALMSLSQLIGQFAIGWLSDKNVSISLLAVMCSVAATVATFALWGAAKSLGLLIAFSLVYGMSGYGFGVMRVAMGRAVSNDSSSAVITYSILVFMQGIGNVLVAPLSSALLSGEIDLEEYAISRYKTLVIFTGSCMIGSTIIIGVWYLLPMSLRSRTLKFGN